MSPEDPLSTEPEDQLYLSYLCSLAVLDRESKVQTPNLKRIHYLRARADADRAELECMALRLTLTPKADLEQLKVQLLQAAEKALTAVQTSAKNTIDENAHSHPMIAGRALKVSLEKTSSEAVDTVEAVRTDLLSEVSIKNHRARRIEELLKESTIAEYKREILEQLDIMDRELQ